MSDETFQRSTTTELVAEPSGDGHTVTVRLVPWNTPTPVRDRGRRDGYLETYARGGLTVRPGSQVLVEREHDGPVVGLLVGTEDREDGLYGTIRVSRSTAGRDLLADLDLGEGHRIIRAVSVDFYDRPVPPGATEVRRTSAVLRRVAFVLEPGLDAPVVSVRSVPEPDPDPTPTPQEPTVNEALVPPAPPAPAADPDPTAEVIVTRSAPTIPVDFAEVYPAPRFESFGHFARAAALGEIAGAELHQYQRALADLTTADAPGMIRDQWINEFIDLARTYTPTVNGWRTRPLPDKGMAITQPTVVTAPTVGKQSAEKAEITSTEVEIDAVQWPIDTYAGGNDVSIQLLRRAEPDFLNELMRLYTRELARAVNTAALTALNAAAAVGVSGNTALEYTTAAAFDELVIDASGLFLGTLGRPADQMALSVDLWKALGKAKAADGRPLYPSLNPMNTHGRMDATGTSGEIATVDWYVEPALGAGIKGVIGVSEAFVTAVGPVGTLTADVPSKLGRDVAVYQEAAAGAADPAGLIQIVNATP